jgi:adenine-specific DNA-methyltransferase
MLGNRALRLPGVTLAECPKWFSGADPWVLSSPDHLALLRSLEDRYPLLEGDGKTSVRIGVATGCDRVLIVSEGADIEPQCLVPLVMRGDIESGRVKNGGRFVVNTYRDQGGVIDLCEFPRLAKYLEANRPALARRHVAKQGDKWFRTIDRVYPAMVKQQKLLIPDIAGANEVVFDPGHYYPHHNLYFVVSDTWDLEVLGGLLSSRVALFFVWSYAVKMRGGYLRFQAQYLRRIRVPDPNSIAPALSQAIRRAFRERDFRKLDRLACEAYGLSELPEFDFVDTRS